MMLIVLAETGKSEFDRQDKRLEALEILNKTCSSPEMVSCAPIVLSMCHYCLGARNKYLP